MQRTKFPTLLFFVTLTAVLFSTSCKKYLDAKPDPTQVEPLTLQDLQALLDGIGNMNNLYPVSITVVGDEYFLTPSAYASLIIDKRNNYTWNSDATDYTDYSNSYRPVYYSNVVLNQLSKNTSTTSVDYNNVKGEALFFRSFAFYHIAQLWCKPYSLENANSPGIPLRLSASIDEKSERATVQQTYDRIVSDLTQATQLLPESNIANSRPNKAAAFGALARVYLSMRDYVNAGRCADSCLKRFSTLIDFTKLSTTSTSPISRTNVEDIFYAIQGVIGLPTTTTLIDSNLYKLYAANDLRKSIYFASTTGGFRFKGSYNGGTSPYCGIATDEMYLIRAEAFARAGNKDAAMADLNTLLSKRWKANTFVLFTATDPNDALRQILTERKKELIYRGTRWMDIRRLNLENANITLTRVVNGTTFTLPPNDLRTVLLIPWQAINLSDMRQNPR